MYPKIVASKLSISPSTPITHKICKNCKHFKSDFMGVQYGTCSKFGEQNLVHGKVTYQSAQITREYDCKGDYFEDKELPFYRKLFRSFEMKNDDETE